MFSHQFILCFHGEHEQHLNGDKNHETFISYQVQHSPQTFDLICTVHVFDGDEALSDAVGETEREMKNSFPTHQIISSRLLVMN